MSLIKFPRTLIDLPNVRLFSNSSSFFQAQTGVNFEINDKQKELVAIMRKAIKDHVIPKAKQYDIDGTFAKDVHRELWKLGLLNMYIEKELGGPGLSTLDACLLCEEIGYGCTGVGNTIMGSNLGQTPISLSASKEQKKKYFGRLVDEPIVAGFCVTEPAVGSNVAGVTTTAEKKGNEYIVNGQKMWITNAGYANWFFLLARTNQDPKCSPFKALSGFILDGDTPGIKVGRKENMMGQKACDTRGILFEDVRIPVENLIQKEGNGFNIAMGVFDRTRPMCAAHGVGMAQRCIDEATKYALEREAFGTKIFNYQAISFMIADIAIGIETARNAYMRAAWERDQGRPNALFSAICKANVGELALKASSDAVQILGAKGCSAEYPVEKLLRDAKIFAIYEGTTQIQKNIISKELVSLLKKRGTTRTNY